VPNHLWSIERLFKQASWAPSGCILAGRLIRGGHLPLIAQPNSQTFRSDRTPPLYGWCKLIHYVFYGWPPSAKSSWSGRGNQSQRWKRREGEMIATGRGGGCYLLRWWLSSQYNPMTQVQFANAFLQVLISFAIPFGDRNQMSMVRLRQPSSRKGRRADGIHPRQPLPNDWL
jgi:hypothetical protein